MSRSRSLLWRTSQFVFAAIGDQLKENLGCCVGGEVHCSIEVSRSANAGPERPPGLPASAESGKVSTSALN